MNDFDKATRKAVSRAVGQGASVLADGIERYSNVAAAWLAGTVTARAHDAAKYLRSHDGDDFWHDARKALKRKPWLVAGAGVVGGLIATRAYRAVRSGWRPPGLS